LSIGIVDVGIGNIGSLRNAVLSQGWDVVSVQAEDDLEAITHLLLPGVGAFGAAMEQLARAGLVEPIRRFAMAGRPLMGICLGMQLLADRGAEGGDAAGLALIPGQVVAMTHSHLPLPHVGWNEAHQLRPHPVLRGIRDDIDFYFVHSFRLAAGDATAVLAETEYGERFPSIVAKGSVIGTQFHPEKSQTNGLRMLDNFCAWDAAC